MLGLAFCTFSRLFKLCVFICKSDISAFMFYFDFQSAVLDLGVIHSVNFVQTLSNVAA